MDFGDVSSKLKKAREAQDSTHAPAKALDMAESYRLRAKMLGVLVRDARLSANRSMDDCARHLRVPVEQVEAWEFGDETPSLPQVELLATYLGVSISHFWGTEILSGDGEHQTDVQQEYLALRDRMVGALLRQARADQDMSLEDLSQASNIPVEQLERYELGEDSMPMHELTVLASQVQRNMSYFLESSSYIGRLLAARQDWAEFTDLPEDVRQFVSRPLNRGFIEIAMMLSQMPTDKLRLVGESMLEITM
jgi:transcriptional regulator with XRE-family HTH domain